MGPWTRMGVRKIDTGRPGQATELWPGVRYSFAPVQQQPGDGGAAAACSHQQLRCVCPGQVSLDGGTPKVMIDIRYDLHTGVGGTKRRR
jgi:hypothetical protein